jgi:addiction module HigA family antidote
MGQFRQTEKPKHPGLFLREMLLPELGMPAVQLAECLGVAPEVLSEIIFEREPVTADMAMRLACFFGNTPQTWLNLQQAYDLWELQQAKGEEYSRIRQYNI